MFSVYLSVISSTFPILTLQIIPVSCQTYYPSLEKGGNTELPFLGQFCLFPKSQWNVKPPHPIFVYVFVFVFVLISTCIKAIAGGTFVSAASPPSPLSALSQCTAVSASLHIIISGSRNKDFTFVPKYLSLYAPSLQDLSWQTKSHPSPVCGPPLR